MIVAEIKRVIRGRRLFTHYRQFPLSSRDSKEGIDE